MEQLLAAFEKEHPNITVKLQNVPAEEATEKLTARVARRQPARRGVRRRRRRFLQGISMSGLKG